MQVTNKETGLPLGDDLSNMGWVLSFVVDVLFVAGNGFKAPGPASVVKTKYTHRGALIHHIRTWRGTRPDTTQLTTHRSKITV
jgi:hypothetical protein